jgi:LPXTG-site transpeptidase (sortase) family protein
MQNRSRMGFSARYKALLYVGLVTCSAFLLLFPPAVSAQDASLAQVAIPVLEFEAPVVLAPVVMPTWDVSHLGTRIGYLERTGWFGQPGNTVLAGHATTPDLQPSVWYDLDTLAQGDAIVVTVGPIELHYAVAGVYRVPETDVSLVLPTPYEQLTLLTCAVDSWNGRIFTERIIVVAFPTQRVLLQ